MAEGRKDMNMRDKIAEIVARGGGTMATTFALIAALPDYEAQQARIKELEAALEFYADRPANPFPNEGPWGFDSRDYGEVARTALKGEET
jgi:hypothetical protein